MNDSELTRWIFENLDMLFPQMEWEQYSQGWRSHYHLDFSLSSDKSRDRQTVCLAKSPYCVTDISQGSKNTIQLYADLTMQTFAEARKELVGRSKGLLYDTQYFVPSTKKKVSNLPKTVQITNNWQETENYLNQCAVFFYNGLASSLKTVFSEQLVYDTACKYGLREYCDPNNTVSIVYFPYVKANGAMCIYKQIPYQSDGHRAHGTNLDKVVSAKVPGENTDFEKCFFGEHLITDQVWDVVIVESEKTAVILDMFFKATGINQNCVVLACGGKCWLNSRLRRSVLDGRNVYLCPDLSKGEDLFDWNIDNVKESIKSTKIRDIRLYDFFAKYATPEEKSSGADIGDIVLRMMSHR